MAAPKLKDKTRGLKCVGSRSVPLIQGVNLSLKVENDEGGKEISLKFSVNLSLKRDTYALLYL